MMQIFPLINEEKIKNNLLNTFFVIQRSARITKTELADRQKFFFKYFTLVSCPSVECSVAVAPFSPINAGTVNTTLTFTRSRQSSFY
jgi:hypothetical protein